MWSIAASAVIGSLVIGSLPPADLGRDGDSSVHQVARELGAYDADFDVDGTLEAGGAEFQLHVNRGVLRVRVLVASAPVIDSQTGADYNRLSTLAGALNNPLIGGKYDRAGGFFQWDRIGKGYYLVKDFLLYTDEPDFQDEIDELIVVATKWRATWFSEVSQVVSQEAKND